MRNLTQLLKLATHLVAVLIAITGFYYLKYRPVRNAYYVEKATNIELQKQLQARDNALSFISLKYYELAGMPRYQIEQHLDRIKVKRNSSLEFVPNAIMKIADSLSSIESLAYKDSLIINTDIQSIEQQEAVKDYRHRWWQFWKKRDK